VAGSQDKCGAWSHDYLLEHLVKASEPLKQQIAQAAADLKQALHLRQMKYIDVLTGKMSVRVEALPPTHAFASFQADRAPSRSTRCVLAGRSSWRGIAARAPTTAATSRASSRRRIKHSSRASPADMHVSISSYRTHKRQQVPCSISPFLVCYHKGGGCSVATSGLHLRRFWKAALPSCNLQDVGTFRTCRPR
jgi:hypothetical protein